LATLDKETAGLGWIHTVPNAAVLTTGLLYGDGDFTRTLALTVRGGLDTDSNGATAGSVAGVLCGAAAVPEQWRTHLADTVRSAVFGYDGISITELADRTARLAREAREAGGGAGTMPTGRPLPVRPACAPPRVGRGPARAPVRRERGLRSGGMRAGCLVTLPGMTTT